MAKNSSHVTIDSKLLRDRLVAQKVTQKVLAQDLGVHERTVLRWLNGTERKSIRRATAARLATRLECSIGDISADASQSDHEVCLSQQLANLDLNVLLENGSFREVVESLAVYLHRRAHSNVDKARLSLALGIVQWLKNDLSKAEEIITEALSLGVGSSCKSTQARAHILLGIINLQIGKRREGKRHVQHFLSLEKHLHAKEALKLQIYLGQAWISCGQFEDAQKVFSEILKSPHAVAPKNQGICHYYLGLCLLSRKSSALAGVHFNEGLTIAEEGSLKALATSNRLGLCELSIEAGDLIAAETMLRASEVFYSISMHQSPDYFLLRSKLKLKRGDAAGAKALMERCLQLFNDNGTLTAMLELFMAEVEASLGEYKEAETRIKRSRNFLGKFKSQEFDRMVAEAEVHLGNPPKNA